MTNLTMIYEIWQRSGAIMRQLNRIEDKLDRLPQISDLTTLKQILEMAIDENGREIRQQIMDFGDETRQDLDIIIKALTEVPPQAAVAFRAFLLDDQGNRIRELNLNQEGKGETMDAKVTDPGLHVELVAVDKFGNEGAALDGPVVWSADAAFVNVGGVSADGLKADITFVGPTGDTIVTAKGDGDLGPGVTEVAFSQDLHLMPGSAVTFKTNVTAIPAPPA